MQKMQDQEKKMRIKIVLLGDGFVGKTSLRRRFFGENFKSDYLETIGADFSVKMIEHNGTQLSLQIWDLAGQPIYEGVRALYYKKAQIALVVFDVTNPQSAANIHYWVNALWCSNGRGIIPFILLGNKADLKDSAPHIVPDSAITEFLTNINKEIKPLGIEAKYFETSAKTGKNVDAAFQEAVNQVFKSQNVYQSSHSANSCQDSDLIKSLKILHLYTTEQE